MFLVIILIIFSVLIFRVYRNRPIGSKCTSNTECNTGLVCDGSLGVCRGAIGTSCTSASDCTTGSVCTSGACSSPVITNPQNPPLGTVGTGAPATQTDTIITVFSDCDSSSDEKSVSFCESSDSSCSDSWSKSKSYPKSSMKTKGNSTKTSKGSSTGTKGSSFSSSSSNPLSYSNYSPDEVSEELHLDHSSLMSNMQVSKVEKFSGKLYGIRNGNVYSSQEGTQLVWKKVNGLQGGIIHLSVTGDGKFLWLQSKDKGTLITKDLKVHSEVLTKLIRTYGKNKNTYIDSDPENDSSYSYIEGTEEVHSFPYGKFVRGRVVKA